MVPEMGCVNLTKIAIVMPCALTLPPKGQGEHYVGNLCG